MEDNSFCWYNGCLHLMLDEEEEEGQHSMDHELAHVYVLLNTTVGCFLTHGLHPLFS